MARAEMASSGGIGGIGTLARRVDYVLRQGSRVALYTAHAEALRRINRRLQKDLPAPPAPPKADGPVPGQRRMLADIAQLFARDLAAIEAGVYPMPRDGYLSPLELIGLSRRFFSDVPAVARRRAQGTHQEVAQEGGFAAALPRYYRQNFHFQTDGWLSEDSARLYDFQVEVLFSGATAAMRRRALVPFAEIVRRKDQRRLAYLDLACGTGGLLRPALAAFPRLTGVGLDLSEPYLRVARERMASARARFAAGLAESLPFADASLDVVSCIYLFHELPPKIRKTAATEIARVLKPGGRLLFVDSLQRGDVPDYDGLLSLFPQLFHEPYYASYLTEDLDALFGAGGLRRVSVEPAFVSRVAVYEKA
ncbi:class I SAM-dependent methyltransferase [Polymorphum gilvum]|uniref:Methyltransferase domain family n=1 Tax=Polymorphum gilvum (strain LMG 25793 / CGMCC 1.9160 / SL003B-26A1) TaxID=991905 RepID=F2IYB7_POLGS|nr:class I SAM-dependent methyltransferase [Polymorphum gilvum]ADZ71729.1 Methyltransferase domain family [Polymorphum gilvum SL003B-26A1]